MSDAPAWVRQGTDGVLLELHVQPGARRSGIIGPYGDRLKVAIASPPLDGRANDALLVFLADRLQLRRSDLALVSGESSRKKRVRIAACVGIPEIVTALSKQKEQAEGPALSG